MLPYFQLHYQDNVIAGFIYTFIVFGLTYLLIIKKMLICKKNWCFRYGHHKVPGTHYKTCPKHTNDEVHKDLQARHAAKHPETHAYLKKDDYERWKYPTYSQLLTKCL